MATPLSAQAARALEQVKMGLLMLYGASYFTEDEWIKIDGLIHKGQYLFTSGPPNPTEEGNLLGGELMSFEDPNAKRDLSLPMTPSESFETVKAHDLVVTESQVDSPTESDCAVSSAEPTESLNKTTIEASSDDGLPAKVAEPDPVKFDFSQWDPPAEPVEPPKPAGSCPDLSNAEAITDVEAPALEDAAGIPKREPVAKPTAGGLAFYTQAQLDEVKAFNQNLTKAGKKGKRARAFSQSGSSQPSEPTAYPPAPSESDTRIQSWASDVKAQEPRPRASASSPVMDTTREWPARSIHDQPNDQEPHPAERRPPFEKLPAVRRPKSSDPQLNVAAGTILIAQNSQVKKHGMELEIRSGDRIRILKHVSGVVHLAENMRTKIRGQLTESVFRRSPPVTTLDRLGEQQRMIVRRAPSVSGISGISGGTAGGLALGLDAMERRNAAEWDEVPVRNRRNPVTPTKPKAVGGFGASRFAVLDETKSAVSSASEDMVSRDEVARMVDEKFAQLLAARHAPAPIPIPFPSPAPAGRQNPSMNEPLQSVTPKTATCWFWATPNKSCRFTADECRDLHAFLPPSAAASSNLRMGKPSWAALVDSIPPPTTAQIQAQITPSSLAPAPWVSGPGNGGSMSPRCPTKTARTCWYWANEKCQNSAEGCKYLHEHCAAGVAHRPYTKNLWTRWNKPEATDEFGTTRRATESAEDEEGELVLETVEDEGEAKDEDEVEVGWGESAQPRGSAADWDQEHLNNGWGEPSGQYKPSHVKALEEKTLQEQVGW